MSECSQTLRCTRYIESFVPPTISEKLVHEFCESVADVFLGKIEYGKDYAIRTELEREDWQDGYGIKFTYSLDFKELVRCRDCAFFGKEYECWLGKTEPGEFCSRGKRRDG